MALLPKTRHTLNDPDRLMPSPGPESDLKIRDRDAMSDMDGTIDLRSTTPVSATVPSMDLMVSEEEFLLTIELPGVPAEEIDLNIDDGRLTVTGEKQEDRATQNYEPRITEREFGAFERNLTIPQTVDPEGIEAEIRDGVLTVHLPREPASSGRKVEIRGDRPITRM